MSAAGEGGLAMVTMALLANTGAVREEGFAEKLLSAQKAALELRLEDPSIQNWVFSAEDAKFLQSQPTAAFDQSSIQTLPAKDQVKLARITGVLRRHKEAAKDDTKSLMYAALIAMEVKSGTGGGQKPITETPRIVSHVSVSNGLASEVRHLEEEVYKKTACQLAEVYVDDGKGQYEIPWHKRGGLSIFRGTKTGFEPATSDPKWRNKWQWHFASVFSAVFGLPRVVAGCPKLSKMVVIKPMLKGAPDIAAPPLWDLVYPSSRADDAIMTRIRQEPVAVMDAATQQALSKYKRVEFTKAAQRVLAMRALAQVRVLHAFGFAHNRITPHTMRVDVTQQMTVWLMDLRDIAVVDTNARLSQGSNSAEPCTDTCAFDLYSLRCTFLTAGMEEAVKVIDAASADPSDWRAFPAKPKNPAHADVFAKYPSWKEQHNKRVQLLTSSEN
jgi:hypothetical protein